MKRTLFSLVLLLGLVLPAATEVMAQPTAASQTFVSEITGDEIDLGSSGDITFIEDDYELRETRSFQEEYIWFTYGWSNFQLVLIGGPNETADYHEITLDNMVAFYDSWELIDEEITDEHSWFLGEGEIGGLGLIVYYEFELDAFGDIDLVLMQFTDATAFEADLEFVQGEVTIGGNPLLPNTNASELASLTTDDASTPDATSDADDETDADTGRSRTTRGGTDATGDTEEEDSGPVVSRTSRGGADDADESEQDGSEGRSRTSRGGTAGTDDEEDSTSRTSRTSRGGTDVEDDQDTGEPGNETETGRDSRIGRDGDRVTLPSEQDDDATDSTPVSGGDWSALGLVSDTEWESPTYGNVVTWDGTTWEFPVDFEHAVVVNDDPPYDIVTLQTTDGFGYVYITIDQAYESTPASMVEYWTSDDYAAQITNGVTVLETGTTSNSATIVYETTNAIDQPLTVVLEATFLDNGEVVFSQISAAPDTIVDVYEQYVDGVQIDGTPLQMTFTVEDIQDISGN